VCQNMIAPPTTAATIHTASMTSQVVMPEALHAARPEEANAGVRLKAARDPKEKAAFAAKVSGLSGRFREGTTRRQHCHPHAAGRKDSRALALKPHGTDTEFRMPRNGALTLGEYPLRGCATEVRFRCGRQAVYRKAELCKRACLNAALPTLRLKIAQRVGCEIAAQNLAGPAPGLEQCQMGFPDS
jgi:hypothetical protein